MKLLKSWRWPAQKIEITREAGKKGKWSIFNAQNESHKSCTHTRIVAQNLWQNRWLRCKFSKIKTFASYLHPASGTMFTSAKDLFRLVSFAVFQALPTHTSHNLYSVFLDLSLQWDSARLRIYSLKFQTQRKSRKTAMKLFSVLPMFLLMLSVSGNLRIDCVLKKSNE